MKLLCALLLYISTVITTTVTAQSTNLINVTVLNVTSNNGTVNCGLFNKANFLQKPIKSSVAKIIKGVSTLTFKQLPKGDYAVVCYHDKNKNNIMDFSANNMPLEDYGSSNNSMAFAPPSYDTAKFVLDKKELHLNIKF
jgi:Uncharacterized protein conserved in bacteria